MPLDDATRAALRRSTAAKSALTPDAWAAGGLGAAEVVRPGSDAAIYDPAKSASVANIAIGSFLDSPEDKLKWFARQRGLDPSAYRLEPGGGVSYLDPGGSGKRFLEVPPPKSGAPVSRVANEASTALPALGGAVGALAGAGVGGVSGYATRSLGAGAGSAAGEYVREWLREQLGGPPPSAAEVGVQAAAGLAGQGVGEPVGIGVGKLARPIASALTDVASGGSLRAPRLPPSAPSDVGLLDEAAAASALRHADDLSPPVQLTTAEATGLPSQISRQRFLQSSEGGLAPMQQGLAARSAAFDENMERFLTVGAKPPPVASALYRKAFDAAEPTDLGPVFEAIDREIARSAAPAKKALINLKSDLRNATRTGDVTWNLELLDDIKKNIDNMAFAEPGTDDSVKKSIRAKMTGVREALVKATDENNPLYAAARRQHMIENAPSKVAEKLGAPNVTAREIMRVKSRYLNDPELTKAWNDGVKMHLGAQWRDMLEAGLAKPGAYKPAVGINRPAEFAGRWRSDPERMRALRAALGPRDLRHFDTLMEVAELTGTAGPFGSMTGVKAAEKADVTKSRWAGAVRLLMPLARILEARQQGINLMAPGSEARAARALFHPDMRRLVAQYRAAVAGRNTEAAARAATTIMLRATANIGAAQATRGGGGEIGPGGIGALGSTAGSKLGETAAPAR